MQRNIPAFPANVLFRHTEAALAERNLCAASYLPLRRQPAFSEEVHMDKRLTGVLAAAATVATVGAAQALPQATSYAELLGSVPNATDVLKADDQARAERGEGKVQLVQFYHHHHHHHHHHRVFIRHHHHHHHHHHRF